MKITLEPSKLGRYGACTKVVIDSQNDEDSTGDAMDMLVGALMAYTHHKDNIDDWCRDRVEMLDFARDTDDDGSCVLGSIDRCGDVEDYEGSDAFAKLVPTTGLDELTVNP